MVIIGLLVSYVAPKYFAQIGKSEVKATRDQIDSLGKALDQYRLDTGHYPPTEQYAMQEHLVREAQSHLSREMIEIVGALAAVCLCRFRVDLTIAEAQYKSGH